MVDEHVVLDLRVALHSVEDDETLEVRGAVGSNFFGEEYVEGSTGGAAAVDGGEDGLFLHRRRVVEGEAERACTERARRERDHVEKIKL